MTALTDNGGSRILNYKLYVDDGDASQENWSVVTSYSGLALSFVVDKANEPSLERGKIYRFRISAVNVIGEGPVSNNVRVALSEPVLKPDPVTINRELSSIDSLFVEWAESTPGDIPLTGYRLYMIQKGTGVEQIIYDGSLNPLNKRFWVQDLEQGLYYAFYVVAIDFNGESNPSDETVAVVCVTPGHLESPKMISTSLTSI